jgi:phospholipid/cholesterol/gamma-HCH transport system ATP-binding protein
MCAMGTNAVLLDAETKTMLAVGHPKTLVAASQDPRVRHFLPRGGAST